MAKSEGKERVIPCIICGEDRFSDEAHFPALKSNGGTKTIYLCPTHHKLLDNGRLSMWEFDTIWKKEFYSSAKTLDEFFEWAHGQGYPYSLAELKNKKIWKQKASR